MIASGWRLPESSPRSTALSGAYIANANGADTTYYNPANIQFNPNIYQVEIGLMNANLESIKYKDKDGDTTKDGKSEEENTLIPSIFITTPDISGLRYGFSITVPGGLTKRWESAYQKTYAEEFSLRIIEFNPTMSYLINKDFSIAGGLRVIYSDGTVKSDGTEAGKPVKRDMEGTTTEYGYNLALAYKPEDNSNVTLTYRSNVDLTEEGNAQLYVSGTKVYDGGAEVTVPLPAVLTLAYAHTQDKTTVELEFDRTYWSSYENLDFEYKSEIAPILQSSFDTPKKREWKDTNAYRIGITHEYNDDLSLMFGFSADGNPINEEVFSFESPDYNSNTYSFGFDYKLDKDSSFGMGYLLSEKTDRTVSNTDATTGGEYIDGTFTNAKAHLLSFGYRMGF